MGYIEFFCKICLSLVLVLSIIAIMTIGVWEIFGGNRSGSTVLDFLFLVIPFSTAILSMIYLMVRIWKHKWKKRP